MGFRVLLFVCVLCFSSGRGAGVLGSRARRFSDRLLVALLAVALLAAVFFLLPKP